MELGDEEAWREFSRTEMVTRVHVVLVWVWIIQFKWQAQPQLKSGAERRQKILSNVVQSVGLLR